MEGDERDGAERATERLREGVNDLQDVKIAVDVFDVLRAELRQVAVLLVDILHGEQRLGESLAELLLLLHGHISHLL